MGISIILRPIGSTPSHALWEWRVTLGQTTCQGVTYSRQAASTVAHEVALVLENNSLEVVA
jgi:hypothetical protein